MASTGKDACVDMICNAPFFLVALPTATSPLGVQGTQTADRPAADRRCKLDAEDLRRQVNMTYIYQSPGL